MRHDLLYLQDILDAAGAIAEFLAGATIEQFAASDLIRSAVLQKLMVIGEAAANVGPELRTRAPKIPWTRIVGFRNLAVHRYFRIDWEIVWTTATIDVPELQREVRDMITTTEADKPPSEGNS